MKIGILKNHLNVSGGGERQAIMLAIELSKMGHMVIFYTTQVDKENCFPDDIKNLNIASLDKVPTENNFLKRTPLLRTVFHLIHENSIAKALSKLIDDDIDVLNTHDIFSTHIVHYYKKRNPSVRSVLMLNDVHTARWSLFDDPLFNEPRKPLLKRPINWLKDMYENIIFLKSQDKILVLNERSIQFVNKYHGREATVIRSGVDLDKFEYVKRTALDKSKTIKLLANGIFFVHRRFEDVVGAVKLLILDGYKIELDIIGGHNRHKAEIYYKKLVDLVERLDIKEKVFFRGKVSDDDLVDYYKKSDIFISAAHMWTWGLANFEALSAGLPLIISDTIGASEVLNDGEQALFIKPGRPDMIYKSVKRLINDGNLYTKLSRNGNEYVRNRFTWKRYALDMLNHLTE